MDFNRYIIKNHEEQIRKGINKIDPNYTILYLATSIVYDNIIATSLLNLYVRERNIE